MAPYLSRLHYLKRIHKRVRRISQNKKFLLWNSMKSDLCQTCKSDIVEHYTDRMCITEEQELPYVSECIDIEWICQVKKQLYQHKPSMVNEIMGNSLMDCQDYIKVLRDILKNNHSTKSLDILHHTHLLMKDYQPHLRPCVLEAEKNIYSHYMPWPWEILGHLPPMGQEFLLDNSNHPCTPNCDCEECNSVEIISSSEEEEEEQAGEEQTFEEELNNSEDNESAENHFSPKENSGSTQNTMPFSAPILTTFPFIFPPTKMFVDFLAKNVASVHPLGPCHFCLRLKTQFPNKKINCTGIPLNDKFKFYMHSEMPPNPTGSSCPESYIRTLPLLEKRIDEIFLNLKYLERALEIFKKMCHTIHIHHPHMKKYTRIYQAIFFGAVKHYNTKTNSSEVMEIDHE